VDGANTFQIFGVNTGVTLILRNLRIQNGSSTRGGGGVNSTGTLTVTNCAFSGNAANSGGGIASSGMLTVTNSTFSSNSASDFGGGIFNGGMLTVTHSTFSSNSATNFYGGGIFNGGTLTVTNSTFSGNSAAFGGGIANDGPTASASVTNSTFSGNSAGDGDGVDNLNGSVTLKGTILANESSGNCIFTINDAGYNISDDNTCGFSGTSINNSTTLKLDRRDCRTTADLRSLSRSRRIARQSILSRSRVAPTSHRRRRKL